MRYAVDDITSRGEFLMRWMSLAAQRSIIRGITLGSIAAMLVHPVSLLRAQSPQVAPRPNVRFATLGGFF